MLYLKNSADDTFSLHSPNRIEQSQIGAQHHMLWQHFGTAPVLRVLEQQQHWPGWRTAARGHSHMPDLLLLVLLALLLLLGRPVGGTTAAAHHR